jgi:RNA polymerase sigma-70 factor, ECF subfamily
VRRSARERQRRERLWLAVGVELAEDVPDPRSGAVQERLESERLHAVRAAIEALPPQQRRCLLLRVGEELSYEEISKALRVSLNTVRNHLAAAKKALRRRLEPGPASR